MSLLLKKRPLIGITMDYGNPDTTLKWREISSFPVNALKFGYAECVIKSGGIPVAIPVQKESVPYYAELLDGLILTGGPDWSPKYSGIEFDELDPSISLNLIREEMELTLLDLFFKTKKPILGICAGFQLLNIYCGGTLIQHLPDWNESINHDGNTPTQAHHTVQLEPDSPFYTLTGAAPIISVNSHHHQGINTLGLNLAVGGTSPDGLIEALYHREHPFCLGVEWHPEFEVSSIDLSLFLALINQSVFK